MKIIQVVGLANSGKTTFIKKLIPALNGLGRVGVIKHLGDHEFTLEEGKDTTGFFEAGAHISVGIDADKSIVTLRCNSLDVSLLLLHQQDIDFAIIEGFKQRSFPKIVIGDLVIENSILVNPAVSEVITSLNRFENFNI
jgi:molybdopterin-guanine dinucleotide biosynthesis protein MobB